eukprot:TRINITY_DN16426_c0_g1_i1.p1 TRINITY_DN16426_c0_g1~~TRINITY_DN16426_c0_g1_i1.p1  ORF type:complete len:355 (+),score=71.50 TRINITY_DN16426_c0_g1_i1:57-1067(+)
MATEDERASKSDGERIPNPPADAAIVENANKSDFLHPEGARAVPRLLAADKVVKKEWMTQDIEEGLEDPPADADNVDHTDQSHSLRPEGVRAVARLLTADTVDKKAWVTPNIKALIVTSFLFALITVAQVFAAQAAHSQALLMDCISMGVDALTYMGNIVVECCKRNGGEAKGAQLVCCAISLGFLLYFTYTAAQESWGTVQICRGQATSDGSDDDVNGWIVLGFALGGVVFDLLSLWAFHRSNKKTGEGRHLNMFTALLHVGADFLRSTSTTVMSLLILTDAFDSTCLDAYTSLCIGATIIIGGLFGVFNWLKLLREFLAGRCKEGKQLELDGSA